MHINVLYLSVFSRKRMRSVHVNAELNTFPYKSERVVVVRFDYRTRPVRNGLLRFFLRAFRRNRSTVKRRQCYLPLNVMFRSLNSRGQII